MHSFRFAPTRLRGKIMTAVFMCQPLGQLAATLVALIATARQRHRIPSDATITTCTGDCLRTLDSIWRWIIGAGVIPAVVALWFRLTIIESPRYTADVGGDSGKALSELNRYLPSEEFTMSSSSSVQIVAEPEQVNQRHSALSASEDDTTLRNTSGGNSQVRQANDNPENPPIEEEAELQAPPEPSWEDFKNYFWHRGNLRTLMATSLCWFFVDLYVDPTCQVVTTDTTLGHFMDLV